MAWLFILFFTSAIFAQNRDDAQVRELETLRLKTFAYKADAQAEIDQRFIAIKPDATPKAWIKGYALASPEVKHVPYATALATAQKLGDPHLLAEIILSQALQARGDQSMDQTLGELKKARDAAKASGDSLLVGMILAETAYTYSIFHNRHGGIQVIEEALAIMKDHPLHPHYLYAQSTLSILLYQLERKEEALRISKEVYQKFSAQKNYYSAAIEACNIGLAYRQIDPHSREAITYFDSAIQLAGKSGDRDALAGALNGKAHAYLATEPQQAIPLLLEVLAIYHKAGDKVFETESILTLAEAYLNAKEIQNARKMLDQVAPNPKFGSIYTERTLYLKSRVNAAAGDFEEAYKSQLAYHDYWQTRKETEEDAELNKLASSLNLKLEEEKNRTLQVELRNQRQAQSLLLAIIGLFVVVVAAMIRGLWQGYQIKRQKKLLQEIMDSIHEGILRFGIDRRIAPPYSRHVEKLLGHEFLSEGSILDILFPTPSEAKTMTAACLDAILGEDRTTWEFNAVHLPSEIHLRDRIVQLFWHPIPNRLHQTEQLMLVLRDVTEQRNYEVLLQNERHERDAHNARALELRHVDIMQVLHFLQRLQGMQENYRNALPDATAFLRQLHTWKGEARTHGLKILAEEIHLLEDHWSLPDAAGEGREKLEAFLLSIQDYLALLEDPLLLSQGTRRVNLLSLAADLFHDAQSRLEQAGIHWGSVQAIDGVHGWTSELAEIVRSILLHAISNSIDHGFVRAPAEFREGVRAFFAVEVSINDGYLVIDLSDNGQGIRWEHIRNLARARGIAAETKAELIDALFLDGFSTADRMSLSSGRGIGLSAIKSICDERGGKVELTDRPSQPGAHLAVRLPYNSA
ncbi:MAG TPA: ATP-binding protein [Oligoflexus sp.]|uniref:ATP-binding protein n=1 Tax=Oligoflexus sp. TaxID=1971216 RepID=UPI002D7ECE41|nr:ATP-binding protein [Oligoflexus sp.]HET9239417.1 ATP-binding protein [Oligoflexus sp.]